MTTAVKNKLADPKAVAVARAVQDVTPPEIVVILFGSRARGDYNEWSDVDLMLLTPNREGYHQAWAPASKTAKAAAQQEYGFAMKVDVVQIDHPDFRRGRRAVNHVAYDIIRDGIPMTQIPFSAIDPDSDGDDGYPDNWPDIVERLRDALRYFGYMRSDLADGAEKYLGRNAHETLEHCYKALISALGVAYPRTHKLRELEALLDRLSERHGIHIPPSSAWLDNFTGGERYEAPSPLPVSHQEFFDEVEQVKDAIIARVYEITGTTAADLQGGE